jgi:hypothetical protein
VVEDFGDAYAEIIATRPLGIWCTVVHQWMVWGSKLEIISLERMDNFSCITEHHLRSQYMYGKLTMDANLTVHSQSM